MGEEWVELGSRDAGGHSPSVSVMSDFEAVVAVDATEMLRAALTRSGESVCSGAGRCGLSLNGGGGAIAMSSRFYWCYRIVRLTKS